MSSLRMGGAERVVFDLARVQARSGLHVAVLNLGRSTDVLVEEFRKAHIDVVSVGDGGSWLAQWRAILRMLGGSKARVLHIHSPFGLRVLGPMLPFMRCQIVFTRHGVAPLSRLRWRLLFPWVRRFVHAVTFVSDEGQKASAWLHNGWTAQHLVIDNGVDLEVETERPKSEDGRLKIGSVGRLVPLKGQRFLLEAVAALPEAERRKLSVHLFGDGPDRAELESLATELLADVPVVFHGNVMDRGEIYRQIDILAVTSRTEGLSLAIMEAMARAIPVIATDVGGNPSLVQPGKTGLLVPYGDASKLADELRKLMADPVLARDFGAAGRALMAERYSLQRTAERYLDVYGLAPAANSLP